MQIRPPAVPLITVDPYFSVWSNTDRLTDKCTVHWTGNEMSLLGTVTVDGDEYRFMGNRDGAPAALCQTGLEVDALTTTYTFRGAGIELLAIFTTPLILSDPGLLSRPVSFLELTVRPVDGRIHDVTASIDVSEQICLDYAGDDAVTVEELSRGSLNMIKMGSAGQPVLCRSGDDIRINWGYFYLTAEDGRTGTYRLPAAGDRPAETFVYAGCDLETSALFSFAYDDIYSIEYFGEKLKSLWNRGGAALADVIADAHDTYYDVFDRCAAFSDSLFVDAVRAGGEKYAELLSLAYRQSVGSHKLVVDGDGELLFVSKECFSNGCAATVDVSYPSIPLYLLYNPELVRGMMRPIYRYAASDEWKYDFAPHDAGQYPLLNGQVYGRNHGVERQMPVEECGNMLIMEAATAIASGDASFAASHIGLLGGWVEYLVKYGRDPENQLCTDDFAGHLAHNCNLTLKAIMGIASYGILLTMLGRRDEGMTFIAKAKELAPDWAERAANGDGSYRLAFDQPGSWSMKYNIVWDKLFGTDIMPRTVIESELATLRRRALPYGLPLDSRRLYTKSDWLLWTATLAASREEFQFFADPVWLAYCNTSTRVPMADLYHTHTGGANMYGIKVKHNGEERRRDICMSCRTVVGGFFIRLLEYKGIMNCERLFADADEE